MITRLDYVVEIAGNVPCAHYLSGYKVISGIKIPTKRVVHLIDKNNKPRLDRPVIVSIDFSNIELK
jgi:hypothetical protein